jgi:signal transduction histidine kinase
VNGKVALGLARLDDGKAVLWVGGAVLATMALWVGLGVGGRPAAAFAGEAIQLATMSLMAGGGWHAARKASGRVRMGWTFIALTGASWLFAHVLWVSGLYFGLETGGPLEYVIPVGYLLGTPFMVLAATNLFGVGFTLPALYRRMVDAFIATLTAVIVLWLVYLESAFRGLAGADAVTLAYTFVYPIGDAILFGLTSSLLLTAPPAWRRKLGPLAVAFLLIISGDLLYAFSQQSGAYDSTGIVPLLWAGGEVVAAAAAVRFARAPEPGHEPRSVAPYGQATLVPAVAVLMFASYHVAQSGHFDSFLLYGGMALLVAITARHGLHVAEMKRNAGRLEATLATERQVREQAAELEQMKELDRFKTQLLNMTAHELNTPISALSLQMATLKRQLLRAGAADVLPAMDLMHRNIQRLGTLVADTLDVARIQNGRLSLEPARTPLAPLVQEVVATFSPLAQQKHVTVESAVPAGLEAVVDPRRFSQVVYNLVGNAIKFTPQSGTVVVTAEAVGADLQLQVSDSGIGLTAQQLERLFKPFVQVHEASEGASKGTGLGLFISKGIVEQHGGRIWVTSPGPGKGSSFGVRVPRAQGAAA